MVLGIGYIGCFMLSVIYYRFDTRYGIVHSLWHYWNEHDYPNGIHAYSDDNGKTFHAYLDFETYPYEWAYGPDVEYTDGSKVTMVTAERPHLILDDNGYTPLALTTGSSPPDSSDYSFTLLRPIDQN